MGVGEVIATAVARNPNLARASVDIERANASLFEATGIDDWLLAATVGIFIDRNEAVDGNVTGTDSLDAYSVGAEISRLLSTGGRVALSFNGRRRRTVFAVIGDSETVDNTGSLAVNFTQPLLRGRGKKVARAGVRQQEIAIDIAKLQRESEVRSALVQVIHGYWDVALAWEELRIRQASLELAKERGRRTQAAIDAGLTAPTEALAVEQVITTREEAIVMAELGVTQASLRLRRAAFLDIAPGKGDVFATAPLAAGDVSFDQGALTKRAVASSPEIAVLGARGKGATLEVEVAENGLLPSLDASLSFGPQGTDPTIGGATENMIRFRGWSVSAGLSYEQRLQNRAARGRAEVARIQKRRLTIDIDDARNQVAFSIAQSIRLASAAKKRMQLSERTIALAERNVEIEKERFKLGRSTNFDVLQRQDDLQQARLRLVQATVDLLKAQTSIDSLTGDLLGKYGVSVAR